MLIVDHIANGEIVAYPPFLTAMENPSAIPVMVEEIVTLGGAMTAAIVACWAIMVIVADTITTKRETSQAQLM